MSWSRNRKLARVGLRTNHATGIGDSPAIGEKLMSNPGRRLS